MNPIKALITLVTRFSLSVCLGNGPEWGFKTVSFNPLLLVIQANSATVDQALVWMCTVCQCPSPGLQITFFTSYSNVTATRIARL